MTEVIAAIVAAVVAAGLTFAIIQTLARLRRKDAESEAQRILGQANQDAANRLKTAELEIKEKAIQQKAETEKEVGRLRDELRERERRWTGARRRSPSRAMPCKNRNALSNPRSGG